MEPKIEKFFEPVVLTPFQSTPSLDRQFQSIPWSDADSVADCEREAAEAEKGYSDELKSECQMKLSWALVHSKRPEDVLRGIAMLDSGKIDVAVSITPSSLAGISSPLQIKDKVYLLAVGHYRSGDYTRSMQLVGQCLEIAPDWMQALTLKKAIEDKITTDQSQFSSHQPSETIDLQHPIMQKKKKGLVQTRERNPNWTKEEDEALCRAWLRIPENPTDTDYTGARLWDRIREEFIDILGYEADRASTGLMHRWSSIQPRLVKYSGFVRAVEGGTHTSGYNGEGSIGAAKQLYYKSEGRPFKWVGCWLILKDSTKWNSYTQEHECKKHKIARRKRDGSDLDVEQTLDSLNPSTLATPGSNAGSVRLDNGNSPLSQGSHELPRPLGRKVVKKIHRKKNLDHSEALKFFAEEFNNLRKEQKEIAEQEINMAKQREQMKIQGKLELERMRIAAKREKEDMVFEKEIMMADPNSLPTEEGKAWVIAQQKAIWRAESKLERERMRFESKHEQERMKLEKEIMMTDPNLVPTEEGKTWFVAQQKKICARSMQGV